jgi:hypothetical protein
MELVTIAKDDFDLICDIMAGLQAPVSMKPAMIGAAYKPWSEIHNRSFGWRGPEDYAAEMLGRVAFDTIASEIPTDLLRRLVLKERERNLQASSGKAKAGDLQWAARYEARAEGCEAVLRIITPGTDPII